TGRRAGGHDGELRANHCLQPLAWRPDAGGGLLRTIANRLEHRSKQVGEDVFLALEVVVQGRFRNPRRFGDVLYAGRVEAPLGKDCRSRAELATETVREFAQTCSSPCRCSEPLRAMK